MTEKFALITGACGYSAPWVIEKLLEIGWRVRATDLDRAPKEGIKRFLDNPNFEFIAADLTKPETLKPLVPDIDIVFHPAALFSYSAPLELLRKVNVEGTRNLLEVCINSDVKKMVLWSSVAAYGTADPKFYDMPIKEVPIEEMNPKNEGKYDISKREQEKVATEYWEEHKFPISIMRPAPLYGPGSYYGIYILIKYIRDEVLSFAPINLHKCSVPLVHAEDVARAAIYLSEIGKYNGEAYNIVDDNTLDMIDTFKLIATLTDSVFKVWIPIPRKILGILFKVLGAWSKFEALHLRKKIDGKPPVPRLETDTILYMFGNYWFSNEKIKKTGFEFKWPDRRLGLPAVIDWYNKHGWEKQMFLKGSEQMEEVNRK